MRIIVLVAVWLVSISISAEGDSHTIKLQTEMLRLISTPEKDRFLKVTEQLKEDCRKRGDERLFYTTWGNQSTYEATHQNYVMAEKIVNKIAEYAEDQNSFWGKYVVLHTKAVNALQKQDYQEAEKGFLKAVEFRHKYFPGESAGDDLQELMKIANHRKDQKAGLKYAHQILAEPNVAPIHKGRALFRLSQFAFNKNNKEMFDSIYNELMALKQSDDIGTIEPVVEINHAIINADYDEALRLCKNLSPEKRYERMAVIYHRMGDNDKAYEYMAKFKATNDSIVLVSHGNVVASCYVQMNNERLKLEKKVLEDENVKWKHLFVYTLIGAIIIILAFILWHNRLRIKRLEKENAKLGKEREKVQKAFDMKNEFISHITDELRAPMNPIEGFSDILNTTDYELQPEEREMLRDQIKENSKRITKLIDGMAELSLFESKKSLSIDYTLSPNHICRHMVDAMRQFCKPGVRMFYESDLPDDIEVHTNQEAAEALLKHLIENAIQHTEHGVITVACKDCGDSIQTSVTDTGTGIPAEQREHIFDTFRQMGDNMKLQGLGLTICLAIIKLLHGKIWLDNDYTEGARFIFELPKEHKL
ncbi:MAG: HAMP domain-containing histidine kinase [Prevotella sp.]|nr:HAMP domain-containing histidine kinase [Prevotella sp.]